MLLITYKKFFLNLVKILEHIFVLIIYLINTVKSFRAKLIAKLKHLKIEYVA